MADAFVKTRPVLSSARREVETVKTLLIFCGGGLLVSLFLMICGVDPGIGLN